MNLPSTINAAVNCSQISPITFCKCEARKHLGITVHTAFPLNFIVYTKSLVNTDRVIILHLFFMVEHMQRQHVVANSDINMDRADGNAEVAKDAETNKQMLVSGSDLKTLINCVLRNLLICCFFVALLTTN